MRVCANECKEKKNVQVRGRRGVSGSRDDDIGPGEVSLGLVQVVSFERERSEDASRGSSEEE
jgi:hypothetical protein